MNFLNIFKPRKKNLPSYFKNVLWSYDFNAIDPVRDGKIIIVNSINYGDLRHWRWLVKFYGKKEVAHVLETIPATEIRPGARNLASALFSINKFNYEPRSAN